MRRTPRRRTIILLTALALPLASYVAFQTLRPSPPPVAPSPPNDSLTAEEEFHGKKAPVGWVFGRMIGFPGAERPLTSSPGTIGGSRLPASSAVPAHR